MASNAADERELARQKAKLAALQAENARLKGALASGISRRDEIEGAKAAAFMKVQAAQELQRKAEQHASAATSRNVSLKAELANSSQRHRTSSKRSSHRHRTT